MTKSIKKIERLPKIEWVDENGNPYKMAPSALGMAITDNRNKVNEIIDYLMEKK